jgi:catechol 2,3-dioxygenase-like lactoylglutathione lyase family enzyme
MGAAVDTPLVLSVHHTSFTVRDIERAVRFFRDTLGFRASPVQHVPAGELLTGLTGVPDAEIKLAFVEGAGHRLELIQYLAPEQRLDTPPWPCDVGAAHLALTVRDLDAVMAKVVAAGGVPSGTSQTMEDGTRSVYMRSEDGIQMEFIQLPASAG